MALSSPSYVTEEGGIELCARIPVGQTAQVLCDEDRILRPSFRVEQVLVWAQGPDAYLHPVGDDLWGPGPCTISEIWVGDKMVSRSKWVVDPNDYPRQTVKGWPLVTAEALPRFVVRPNLSQHLKGVVFAVDLLGTWRLPRTK